MIGTLASVGKYIWHHPANRGRRLSTLLRAMSWQAYKRITHAPCDFRVGDGLWLRCYPDSQAGSLVLYCNGLHDYHEMRFMHQYLRPGDGFVDVGANIGVYTLLAASIVGRAAHLDAFEPGVRTLARLRENLVLNSLDNVAVHPVAVGSAPGRVRFLQSHDVTNRIATKDVADEPSLEVPCVTLDDELAGRRYAMGKMDIEGAEPLALGGAKAMLAAANPPVWQLEVIPAALQAFGWTDTRLADLLRDSGYELGTYDADDRILRLGERHWRGQQNVFAVASREAEAIARRVAGRLERG